MNKGGNEPWCRGNSHAPRVMRRGEIETEKKLNQKTEPPRGKNPGKTCKDGWGGPLSKDNNGKSAGGLEVSRCDVEG